MTMIRDNKGFTLVELIVVSVLGAFVLGALLQVLITNQRTYTAQSAVIQGQQASRMAIEVMFNELREASPALGDIVAMSPTSIHVKLMRKFGIACDVDLDLLAVPPKVTVIDNSGDDFAAGDTVFIFADNREATPSDDVWLEAEVQGVDDTVTCLGRPAIDLQFNGLASLFSSDSVRVGAPVRARQAFQYYRGNYFGLPYLVRRDITAGETWPIAGPIRAADGLQFVYRDALGNVTSTPADVRQIEVRIRTGSEVINSLGEFVTDSLDTWIYTRN